MNNSLVSNPKQQQPKDMQYSASCLLQQKICPFLKKFLENSERDDISFESSENMELKVSKFEGSKATCILN
jgi:hypothetical protein